ncbi:N-6 DNA methylase [Verrucomicrobiaceae bacterium 5K15]|uniref:site-specific DNA-methyltransferase (adenine-specific) n=1 Tax=Oceaniferula flava TaxID=2800421 RepID=A0AAE2SCR6_9BACT|nr:N-6 DNA methylase [Oceaniferula flavus]MBK1854992.1 N-6 DNA methylase [Oceaniferula flavus]MBM1136298.1 N-6 DNA methylase [Oceaniferula flavus]
MTQNDLVQKLWKVCDILRDDGINYSDYVTELVLLLFIKMEHEKARVNEKYQERLPEGFRWPNLAETSGLEQLNFYKRLLLVLSTGKDADGKSIAIDPMVSAIYAEAQTSLREPRHLSALVRTFDTLNWFSSDKDDLGDVYEGLLEKNATETKSGAGQYFTPRALIDSIVRCVKPQAGETIQDPAAGTAGFLIAADTYIKSQTDDLYELSEKDRKRQRTECYTGVELVPDTRRLALMNCLLHGMEGGSEGVVRLGNTLTSMGSSLPKVDIILANPPFGTAKGGTSGKDMRDDFTFTTSNKQLAFLQHIYRGLKPGGRAAIVLPDNVLFEDGVGAQIRADLMEKCDLHTILRLPTGIFYAQGVKTNVLFFTKGTAKDKHQEEGCTKHVWFYDLRTNAPSYGKRTPFTAKELEPFEKAYGKSPLGTSKRIDEGEEGKFRKFTREQIKERNENLDISWIRDGNTTDSADLPQPEVIADDILKNLKTALAEIEQLKEEMA